MNKLIAHEEYDDIRFDFCIDGNVVGAMSVNIVDNYIHSLEIEEEYRNRGYAREMLRAVMALYPGKRMWLKAYSANTPAIKAYTAVGFTTYKTEMYSYWGGPEEEVSHMEIITPIKPIKFVRKYGLMLIEEDYDVLFDTEEERNEVALSWHEELAYDLFARDQNWYGIDEEWMGFEVSRAICDANDAIYCYEEIVMEEM